MPQEVLHELSWPLFAVESSDDVLGPLLLLARRVLAKAVWVVGGWWGAVAALLRLSRLCSFACVVAVVWLVVPREIPTATTAPAAPAATSKEVVGALATEAERRDQVRANTRRALLALADEVEAMQEAGRQARTLHPVSASDLRAHALQHAPAWQQGGGNARQGGLWRQYDALVAVCSLAVGCCGTAWVLSFPVLQPSEPRLLAVIVRVPVAFGLCGGFTWEARLHGPDVAALSARPLSPSTAAVVLAVVAGLGLGLANATVLQQFLAVLWTLAAVSDIAASPISDGVVEGLGLVSALCDGLVVGRVLACLPTIHASPSAGWSWTGAWRAVWVAHAVVGRLHRLDACQSLVRVLWSAAAVLFYLHAFVFGARETGLAYFAVMFVPLLMENYVARALAPH